MREGDRLAGRFLLHEGPLRSGEELSEVWLAHDERLGRNVVLKRVSEQPLGELRAMARVSHQHVVTLYEHISVPGDGEDAGDWLVMEYAPRGSLAAQPPMAPEQAATVGAQIASALVDLHANGIVHCDIKPANIVLAENGAAKLTDFGAAYRVDDEETISPETRISYTPAYAAPEVVRGNPIRASDVYSLAATVYALVVGESPHVPGHAEHDMGALGEALAMMRRRNPDDRPDAVQAQRMLDDVAAGRQPGIESGPDTTPTQVPTQVPAQLPADVYGFAGRTDELDHLDSLLTRATNESTAVVISAVSGTAGIGKTALAVHWAHRVADRFPDGQLYVNLRGFDPSDQTLDSGTVLRGFLQALGAEPEQIPTDADARTALFRTLLGGKKVLIVLDNARDTEQIRPLLPGTPGCLVVATSRNNLTGLVAREGAHPLTLDQLTPTDAHQLLERRLGPHRIDAEPDAIDQIISTCDRLPLALAIVAARAASRPDFPLATLANQLRGNGRLDALASAEPEADVRSVFSWSYDQLTFRAAQLFRLLGLPPGPDISVAAAASLAGVPPRQARPLLTELAHANLLTEHQPGRYTFHDLLAEYATELAHALDTEAERDAAQERMLDHYLHTADAANVLVDPNSAPLTSTAPRSGVTPEPMADRQQAMDWFAAELAVLLAVLDHAATTRFDTHTWRLAWSIRSFLDIRGHWYDLAAVARTSLAARQRLGDPAGQAHDHRFVALANVRLDRFDEAEPHLRDALELLSGLGDNDGQARVHRVFSFLRGRQGRPREALGHSQRALELYQEIDDEMGQARSLDAIGEDHNELGDHELAIQFCERALELLEKLGHRYSTVSPLESLGFAYYHLGQFDVALSYYQRALELQSEFGELYYVARVLIRLGDAQAALDDHAAARASWQRALTILEELDNSEAEAVRAKLA